MIYVAMLGREANIPFLHGSRKQEKVNVSIGYSEVIDKESKKGARYKKPNFTKATDFVLIENHAILKRYNSI